MKPPPGCGMSDKGLAPRYFDTGASPDCALSGPCIVLWYMKITHAA